MSIFVEFEGHLIEDKCSSDMEIVESKIYINTSEISLITEYFNCQILGTNIVTKSGCNIWVNMEYEDVKILLQNENN